MTMTNAEWMLKNGYKFNELDWICDNAGDYGYVIILKNECIGKVKDCYSTKAITTWLDMEHKEPILDEAERKYLSAFVKPFRNDVTMIRKDKDMACNTTRFRIAIYVSKSGYSYLPWFNSWTMYKGMDLCKAYTLEELGL